MRCFGSHSGTLYYLASRLEWLVQVFFLALFGDSKTDRLSACMLYGWVYVPIYVPICDVLHVSLCVFERTREPGPKRREKETGGRTCRQSLHRLKCTRRHLGMRDCFRLYVDCSVNLSCPLKRTPPCFRSSLPLDLYRRGPLAVRRCD